MKIPKPETQLFQKAASVFLTPSTTEPRLHVTVVYEDEQLNRTLAYCSCPGFQNNRKCWHCDKALELDSAR